MLMMNDQDYEALEALLSRKDYGGLRRALGKAEREALAEVWPRFRPLERLVLFKLMDAPAALEFYRELPFKERYLLLCGFPLNSIAPILEEVGPAERRLFVQLPREFYDRMFRQLRSERIVVTLPLRNN